MFWLTIDPRPAATASAHPEREATRAATEHTRREPDDTGGTLAIARGRT
jgi:hypothetical protein